MDDHVRFALEKLLNVARGDTGQGKRVASFLLAWWNAGTLGGFDVADLFAVDREISEDMATIFTYLALSEEAIHPTEYRSEIEEIIALWRSEIPPERHDPTLDCHCA